MTNKLSFESLYSNLLNTDNQIFKDCDVIQVQPIILKEETLYQQFNKVHKGNILEELADALPRLSHLHVHDNDGCKDQHSAPGQGTIPWRSLLQKLQDISYHGSGALELRDFSKGGIPPAEVIQKEMGHVRKFHQHWASRDLLTPSIKI